MLTIRKENFREDEISVILDVLVPKNHLVRKIENAIDKGICKVNIATELKIPFSKSIKEYFNEHPDASDPRQYLVPAKKAMYDVVVKKIKMCKSEQKAYDYNYKI